MARNTRKTLQPQVETTLETAPVVEATITETTNSEANVDNTDLELLNDQLSDLNAQIAADLEEEAAIAEIDEQIALGNSVVNRKYKIKYKQLAQARGDRGKAAKRSNWDWLAQQIAELTLTPKAKLKVDEFVALMAANGVDCNRWPNRANGWEGRLRMTAGLVLRKQMAEANDGIFHLADGSTRQMPEDDMKALRAKFPI